MGEGEYWSIAVVPRTCRVIYIASPSQNLKNLSRCHSLKLAFTDEITPISHSSSIILINSQKIYYTGTLMRDHGHEFVHMGRTGTIRHVKVGLSIIPS